MAQIKVCVFDAYGTLFDVSAAARELAAEPGREAFAKVADQVAADWRMKQLSYSWLRAVARDHVDFWQVTRDGLDWALERAGHLNEPELREALLGLYWRLSAYPEVPGMLRSLKVAGFQTAILSNGAPQMLAGAVQSAGIGADLDAVLSVEDVGIFKPDTRVYDLVGARFGTTPEEVMFVSSNGWDAAFARAYGFDTLWVNRAAEPVDRLGAEPSRMAVNLTGVPALLGVG